MTRLSLVDSNVFQKTLDYSDEYAHGFHVTLDDGTWVTVRQDQVDLVTTIYNLFPLN